MRQHERSEFQSEQLQRGMIRVAQSANGWTVIDSQDVHRWKINDWAPELPLREGPGGFVLAHFALWFGETVERIRGPVLDDWGYAHRPIRGGSTTWSNHASGTALDINAQAHPLGVRHTFTNRQEWFLVERLRGKYCHGITWGGEFHGRADEMHFEVARDPAFTRALARRLVDTPRGQRIRRLNPGVPLA